MKKLSIILLLAFAVSFYGRAQTAASYGFTALTGTFASISGTGTSVPTLAADDITVTSIPIGFSFTFCGTTATTLSACSNGWVCVNNTSPTAVVGRNNTTANATTIGAGMFSAFWDDLDGSGGFAGFGSGVLGSFTYQTTGTAPNRVFTCEWNNFTVYFSAPMSTWQIKLYETSNIIEYWYGPGTISAAGATIGISNSGTDYQTLSTSSASPTPSSTTFTTAIASTPANGTVYRWTPPSPCSGTPVAGTATCSPLIGSPITSFTLSLTGLPAVSGLTYQWQSSPTGLAGSWTNIPGGTTNPYSFSGITANTYYQCIVTCSASSLSATSTPVMVTYTATPPCYSTAASWISPASTSFGVSTFNITGFSGSTLADVGISGAASTTTGYLDRTALTPVVMQTGGVYASSATWGSVSTYQELQVWIDFNDNGLFEVSEEVSPVSGFSTIATPSPTNFNITIPAGAATGIHNMRLRGVWEYITTSLGVAPAHLDPCLLQYGTTNPQYFSGVVVDYRANIQSPCPFTATASNSGPICPGSSVTLIGGGTAPSYSWSGPGGFTSVATSPVIPSVTTAGIYTLTASNGSCTITATTTVSLLSVPAAPVITPATSTICNGGNISLTATSAIAPVWTPTTYLFNDAAFTSPYSGAATGTVYVHPTTVSSTTTVTYTATATNASGCSASSTASVTINAGLPAITGPSSVCWGGTISLANTTPAGTWSASNTTVATVSPTGVVTGLSVGADTIYYNVTGCGAFKVINVNPGTAITGAGSICTAANIWLMPSSGGTWVSGSPSIATINNSGMGGGVSAGSAIVTFTSSATGCKDSAIINVVSPGVISGAPKVCTGAVTALSETVAGGTWTSSPTAQATVDASSGAVYGVAAGNVTISYTMLPGCFATYPMTVNPSPAAITGIDSVCAGRFVTLADATPSGTWSISAGGLATISTTGVVTGLVAGTPTVTYTAANLCTAVRTITVNPSPTPIVGSVSVCQLAVTTLSSIPAGGLWASGDVSKATVSSGGGVYGINGGTVPISYTTTSGCQTYTTVTVNDIPAAITGNDFVCYAGSTTLSDITSGGYWSSSNPLIASVNASGVVFGIATGNVTISYITGANSCYATKAMTVSPIAPPVVTITSSTGSTVCAGTPVTYVPSIIGGGTAPLYVWSVNNVILSGASSYTYTPADGDLVRVWIISSYACAVPDTASVAMHMTVNPVVTPAVSLTTGMGDTVCTTSLTTLYPIPTGGGATPSYQWTVNGIPSGVGPTYTYAPNNGDIINCIMTSNAPCRTANTATASKTLTVSVPITPTVDIASALGSVTCEGYPDVLTTTMYGGGTAPTYVWSVNGTPAGMGASYTYAPANGDVVTVTMTSNFPCLATPTASDNITLTVLPITQPVGEITAQPGYIIPVGMYDTFTCNIISGGGMAPTYQWFINSVPQPGATNSVYITNNLHTGDSVACQVVNTDQCSGVTVFSYMNITVGNNVGVHDLSGQGSNVMLVPNPNNGTFRVKGNIAGVISGAVGIQVTDMLGRAIYTGNADVVNGVVDSELQLGSDLANGTYLLTIRNGAASNTLHFTLQR